MQVKSDIMHGCTAYSDDMNSFFVHLRYVYTSKDITNYYNM